jgi:hypothetical protein
MFLSWFNFSYTAPNAWESLHYTSPILAISIVATLGVAFAEVREMSIGEIPGGLVIFVLGCLSALLILFRLIDPISTPGIEGGSTSGSVEAGVFLGFFAALGIAAGGYVATDGKAVDRLKALLPSGTGTPGSFPAAPPPPPAAPQPQVPTPAAAPPAPASSAPVTVSPPPQPPSPPVPPVAPEPPVPDAAGVKAPVPPQQPATPPEPEQIAEVDLPAAGSARSAEEDPQLVFCEGCGGELRPQDRFCRKCGHQQAQVAVPGS